MLINIEKLNCDIRKKVEDYCDKLISIHKENLISIFVFGSAANSNYNSKISDVNLAVILKFLNFKSLTETLKISTKGLKNKISAPLFLTKEYINESLDVFPIEFYDMKENNICMYGEDLISNIKIEPTNLRLLCEQQIKGKLLTIRQAYLEVGLNKKGLEALLKNSLKALVPVFRNLIRLKGQTPPVKKSEIITEVSKLFDLHSDVFLAILMDSSNDEKIKNRDIEVYLEKYLFEIEDLAKKVDKL